MAPDLYARVQDMERGDRVNLADSLICRGGQNSVDVNDRLQRLLARQQGGLVGPPRADAWPDLNAQLNPKDTDGPTDRGAELTVASQPRSSSARGSPLVDANGRDLGRLLVLQEITAR